MLSSVKMMMRILTMKVRMISMEIKVKKINTHRMCDCQWKIVVRHADPKTTFNQCMCSRGCGYCYEHKPRYGVCAI